MPNTIQPSIDVTLAVAVTWLPQKSRPLPLHPPVLYSANQFVQGIKGVYLHIQRLLSEMRDKATRVGCCYPHICVYTRTRHEEWGRFYSRYTNWVNRYYSVLVSVCVLSFSICFSPFVRLRTLCLFFLVTRLGLSILIGGLSGGTNIQRV